MGYGIRYEFGIFHQEIIDGWQVEKTDKWLRFGNPWELVRPEWAVEVKFGGSAERYVDEQDRLRVRWVPHKTVIGVPYDTPILGYRDQHREYAAAVALRGARVIRFRGVQSAATTTARSIRKSTSENISKVLYPNDEQVARQGAAARAAIFLRLLLPAGHAAHPAHAEAAGGAVSTRNLRCSSTTRIRRSRSPN